VPDLLKERGVEGRLFLITDHTVSRLYGDGMAANLRDTGREAAVFRIPDGEASKSVRQAEKIWKWMLASGIRRQDAVLALGGGVVGDLAGFAAATVLRGVSWIQVPTTLLAQADASVGGKVGVNFEGKNLVGGFYPPQMVIMDPEVLQTLNVRDHWSGMGEVIKSALIGDRKLFSLLEKRMPAEPGACMELMGTAILRSVKVKARIVGRDERESGLRRLLNLGHTLAHGLERATECGTFRHGEAVIHGLRWAVWFSRDEGWLPPAEAERIETVLGRMTVPGIPAGLNMELFRRAVISDKKQSAGGIRLIVLKGIGRAREVRVADPAPLFENWLRNHA